MQKVTAAERSAVGRQVVRPGRRLSCRSFEETSTNSNSGGDRQAYKLKVEKVPIPGFILRASAITASFSTGFKEQVEYTIRPSCFNIFIARRRIRTCRLNQKRHYQIRTTTEALPSYPCNPFASIVCHDFQIPMFFRIVPSPLQGTSHRILSNDRGSRGEPSVVRTGTLIDGKLDASRLVTMRAGLGSRAVW